MLTPTPIYFSTIHFFVWLQWYRVTLLLSPPLRNSILETRSCFLLFIQVLQFGWFYYGLQHWISSIFVNGSARFIPIRIEIGRSIKPLRKHSLRLFINNKCHLSSTMCFCENVKRFRLSVIYSNRIWIQREFSGSFLSDNDMYEASPNAFSSLPRTKWVNRFDL